MHQAVKIFWKETEVSDLVTMEEPKMFSEQDATIQ